MVKLDTAFPFRGEVVWLTPEQGGRDSGPPPPSHQWDYAHTAFVAPGTIDDGLASFVLRGFQADAWVSPAEGRWLVVENGGKYLVRPGSVLVVTEGRRRVGYFHVHSVAADPVGEATGRRV